MSPHSQEQATGQRNGAQGSHPGEPVSSEGAGEGCGALPIRCQAQAARGPPPQSFMGVCPQCLRKGPLAASGLGWCGTDRTAPPLSTETPPDYQSGRSRAAQTPTALYVRTGPRGRARLGARLCRGPSSHPQASEVSPYSAPRTNPSRFPPPSPNLPAIYSAWPPASPWAWVPTQPTSLNLGHPFNHVQVQAPGPTLQGPL